MMTIKLNDEDRTVAEGLSLADALLALGYDQQQVAVALNEEFVPRSAHEDTPLNEGDRLEVVAPMQGG